MPGLAFPNDARAWDPDEHRSPAPNDPFRDLYTPANNGQDLSLQQQVAFGPMMNGTAHPQDVVHTSFPHSYAPGPEGDPFAPPRPTHLAPNAVPTELGGPYYPAQHPAEKPMKKRKKGVPREAVCGFCQGDDTRNKANMREDMLSCVRCGRSGHPSCMGLFEMAEKIHSEAKWRCLKCKICERCNKKGNAASFLICDGCDSGWHTYCLNPPLEDLPEGKWICPQCTSQIDTGTVEEQYEESTEPQFDPDLLIDPALQGEEDRKMDVDLMNLDQQVVYEREPSVASSSTSVLPTLQARSKAKRKPNPSKDRKGKGRAVILTDDDDSYLGADDETIETPVQTKSRSASNRRKSHRREESQLVTSNGPTTPSHASKRIKVISSARPSRSRPDPPAIQTSPRKLSVKLRLPGRNKSRETREEEEPRKGVFDDVLGEQERDTSRTSILPSDREKYEKSRSLAESKVVRQPTPEPLDLSNIAGPSSGRFPLRSAVHQLQQVALQTQSPSPRDESPTPSTPGPSYTANKGGSESLRIRTIRFGPYEIKTWYDAPFPEEFSNIPEGRLWICEFCLKYMKSRFGSLRHRLKCKCQHPPGDEIYRDENISIFEVDGRRNKIYCQHLCLLSKMFLDHKSLFYDVEPFLFYVITESDDVGARFIGYFSKEKRSSKDLNLSCIMTIPTRQRQGWGNFLIDFSYLLSKKEGKVGTPERPLSLLGAQGYTKYWTIAIMRYFATAEGRVSLENISASTAMTLEDVYNTLVQLDMITVFENAPDKASRPTPGRSVRVNRSRKNGVARRALQKASAADTDKNNGSSESIFVPPASYDIHYNRDDAKRFMDDYHAKGYLLLKPEKLKWTPFLLTRADKRVPPLEDVLTEVKEDMQLSPEKSSTQLVESGPALSDSKTAVDPFELSGPLTAVTESDSATEQKVDSPVVNDVVMEEAVEFVKPESFSVPKDPSPPTFVSPPQTFGLEALAAVASAVRNATSTPSSRAMSSTKSGGSDSSARHRRQSFQLMPISTSLSASNGISQKPPSVSVEKDAELAAQLAREESRSRRSLRSGSAGVPTLSIKDDVKNAEPPSPTVRRRRKSHHESSPLSPVTPITPNGPTTRRQAHAKTIETVKAGRVTRNLSSRLAASGIEIDLGLGKDEGRNDDLKSPIGGRRSSRQSTASPAKSTDFQRKRNGRFSRTSKASTPPGTEVNGQDGEGDIDMDAEGESDEGGAPSASDEPSSAQLVSNGINGLNHHSNSITLPNDALETHDAFANEGDSVASVSDTAVLSASMNGMTVNGGEMNEEDVDAEGEPDEDADGEPDPDLFP